jgi:hypothetical protein
MELMVMEVMVGGDGGNGGRGDGGGVLVVR